MKKVISIIVALALMLSLSIVATPVLADVTAAEVEVKPTDQFAEAEYTVTFNITGDLIAGTTSITVEFPLGTVLPGEWKDGDITVNSMDVAKNWVSVSGLKVTFWSPLRVDRPGPVVVVFTEGSGVKNPPAGDYNLWVHTSAPVDQTRVRSEKYAIGLAEHSTYEFVVDGLVVNDTQVMIHVDQPVEVDVTLRTLLAGVDGYDNVQKQIKLISAPANATVKVGIGGDVIPPLTADAEQLWGANFTIPKVYSSTWTDATMEFDRVGIYTIAFRLLDQPGGEVLVREDVSVTVAGVSFVVKLNKGWNLMSLPIIPVNSAIREVLAGITNWQTTVESVWYYDPTFTNANDRWRSYRPGAPSLLARIEDGKAYWINMKDAADLTVVGVAIVLPGQVPQTYSVKAGWNMVGFKSRSTDTTVEDYLAGTKAVRVLQFKGGVWSSLPVTASHNMTPGLGYWVAFSEPGIIYP